MSSAVLKKFRQLMTIRNLGVYILPRTDEHQSEYLCQCDERISFLSGFTGSNAIALISQEQALLWTDGRYFLQAEKQLQQGWSLRKLLASQKKWFEHLVDKYPKDTTIGIDGRLITAQAAQKRKQTLTNHGFKIQFFNENLVDQIWVDRPKSSANEIFIHEEWAGKPSSQKIGWVRNKINQKKGNAALFNDLSEIGWILNLRSGQIPYNPFFKSILIITLDGGTLFLPDTHVSLKDQSLIKHLSLLNIQISEYSKNNNNYPENILCQKSQLHYQIYSYLKNPIQWEGVGLYRAVRAQKQIQGFRRCHLSDAIAMAKFWTWRSKQEQVDEYQAATYLDNLRFKQKHNKGLSFTTISGGGPNAAVIHYHPTDKCSSIVTKDMIHLVDSGGQYLDGTTDVTRTFHFGKPTQQEKDAYTRVLRGNLDIERMVWPNNVKLTGADVDILARRHLWAKGLEYLHGTGHGVGYFQGVHQGPVGISKYNQTVFVPGMIVTNEPGYYQPGKYGIRIQNMLLVVANGNINSFENLTLCPYDKNLFDMEQFSIQEKNFINNYHQRVYALVAPLLEDDLETLQWLKSATLPI